MKTFLKIRELTFKYKDKVVFDNLNLDIHYGSFTTILGPNGCGKSTLVSLLVGKYKYKGLISFDDENSIDLNSIGVSSNTDVMNSNMSVYDLLCKKIYDVKQSNKDINEDILQILSELKVINLKDRFISTLSLSEYRIIQLACAICVNPKLVILDGIMDDMDELSKQNAFKLLRKLHRSGITIVNVTNDVEQSIHGTDIIILNNSGVSISTSTKKAYLEEKKFIQNGLELPFIVSLSLKLKYYGLVDDIFLSDKKLVDYIWK